MKILFDHQIFELQEYGGISRYHRDLYSGLKNRGIDVSVSIKYSDNYYLKKINGFDNIKPLFDPYKHFLSHREFPMKRKLFNTINRILYKPSAFQVNKENSIKQLIKGDFDIFHATYYDDYFLPYLNKKPFVITIHDLIPEYYPEYFLGDINFHNKRELINNATKLIAISEATKDDLIAVYNIDPGKINVIKHGISQFTGSMTSMLATGKYFLYVGQRQGYKNFYCFVHAIQPVLCQHEDLKIICVGTEFTEDEKSFFTSLNIIQKIHCRKSDDQQLAYLYKNAMALIICSLKEGFGLPVLEAAGQNCPLLLSNIKVFKEIAGDNALYFNPKDVNSMRSVVTNFLKMPKEKVPVSGKIKFSLSKTIKSTIKFYKSVIWDFNR